MEFYHTTDTQVNFKIFIIFISHIYPQNIESVIVSDKTMTTSIIPKIRVKTEGTKVLTGF